MSVFKVKHFKLGPPLPRAGLHPMWASRTDDEPWSFEFEEEKALANLLLHEAVFTNNHWWKKEWPEDAQKTFSFNVNCNDVFAWGCSDAEEMYTTDVELVYLMWAKDPDWGTAVWCMQKRKQKPQQPVWDRIKKAGIWNLKGLALGPDVTDEQSKAVMDDLLSTLKEEVRTKHLLDKN